MVIVLSTLHMHKLALYRVYLIFEPQFSHMQNANIPDKNIHNIKIMVDILAIVYFRMMHTLSLNTRREG